MFPDKSINLLTVQQLCWHLRTKKQIKPPHLERIHFVHVISILSKNPILVPRAHDPFGLRQGSRPLAGTEVGSPRITDFRLLCAASEIWNNNGYYRLQKWAAIAFARCLDPARGLDPWRRPKGSWALGTRMNSEEPDRLWPKINFMGTVQGEFITWSWAVCFSFRFS